MQDRPYPVTTISVSLARFHDLRLRAMDLLVEASRLPALPALAVLQAETSAALSGAQFHRIVGEAEAADFHKLRDDCTVIARRVDQWIAGIGAHAAENSTDVIQRDLFTDQLLNALEGDAFFNLNDAASLVTEARADTVGERERVFRSAHG